MGEVAPLEETRITSGMCDDCYCVERTLLGLRGRTRPVTLIVPGNREDLLLRIWREMSPATRVILRPDRRVGERRQREVPVLEERRQPGRDRRRPRRGCIVGEDSVDR